MDFLNKILSNIYNKSKSTEFVNLINEAQLVDNETIQTLYCKLQETDKNFFNSQFIPSIIQAYFEENIEIPSTCSIPSQLAQLALTIDEYTRQCYEEFDSIRRVYSISCYPAQARPTGNNNPSNTNKIPNGGKNPNGGKK